MFPFLFLAKWSRPGYLISCVCRKSFNAATHTPGQYILASTILLSGVPRTEQATKGSELSFLVLNQSSNVLRTRICPAYYLNSRSLDAFCFFSFIPSHIIFGDNCMLDDTTLSANSSSLAWFELRALN